ncbi:MAG: hypothetical protein GX083_04920 [Clostridiales bacterium]|nr:hypothetical protein [Clostridiales bacterium]
MAGFFKFIFSVAMLCTQHASIAPGLRLTGCLPERGKQRGTPAGNKPTPAITALHRLLSAANTESFIEEFTVEFKSGISVDITE